MVPVTPLLAQEARADRAFERIYKRHIGDVYRYALAVLRNPADAEDVAQTTFLNAYRTFKRGERPRNAQNWLIAIAHNVCRQRFRQSLRRPNEVEYDERIGDVVPEDEPGPTAEDIQRALGYLAFNQRAALVMRELEGRSYAEIAEILETSVSAVETLLFRARRALREQLEGSLTCGEAERAISRQLDRRLPRNEQGALRAHLRECRECERFARSQRAQRTAIKSLAVLPIPSSLTSLFGGGAAAGGGGVAVKAAALVAAGTVATGVGYDRANDAPVSESPAAPLAAAPLAAGPAERPAHRERVVARPAPARLGSAPGPGDAARARFASSPTPAKAKPANAKRPAGSSPRVRALLRRARSQATPAPARAEIRARVRHVKPVPSVKRAKPPARAAETPKPVRPRAPRAQSARHSKALAPVAPVPSRRGSRSQGSAR